MRKEGTYWMNKLFRFKDRPISVGSIQMLQRPLSLQGVTKTEKTNDDRISIIYRQYIKLSVWLIKSKQQYFNEIYASLEFFWNCSQHFLPITQAKKFLFCCVCVGGGTLKRLHFGPCYRYFELIKAFFFSGVVQISMAAIIHHPWYTSYHHIHVGLFMWNTSHSKLYATLQKYEWNMFKHGSYLTPTMINLCSIIGI